MESDPELRLPEWKPVLGLCKTHCRKTRKRPHIVVSEHPKLGDDIVIYRPKCRLDVSVYRHGLPSPPRAELLPGITSEIGFRGGGAVASAKQGNESRGRM